MLHWSPEGRVFDIVDSEILPTFNGMTTCHFSDKKEVFLDFAEQAQARLLEDYTDNLNGVTGLRERWKVSSDYDLELISHALCGLLRHAMVYASRKNLDREKMIDDLSLFVERGLGVER